MKKLISLGFTVVLIAGCAKKEEAAQAESKPEAPPKNTVTMADEVQKRAGVKVEPVATARITPETKGYGRVVDPAALAGMIGDFTTTQAANEASQSELKRQKALAG